MSVATPPDEEDIHKLRKVFLDDLPRRGKLIDWKSSVGHKVKFIYDDIDGEIKILNYISPKLYVKYMESNYTTSTDNFKNGQISKIVNREKWESLFDIDDVVTMKNGEVKILELIKYGSGEQGYLIQCLHCGLIRKINKDGMLNKSKCTSCSKNTFILSNDGNYWVGYTQNGEEFWFDGDEDTINYIKSQTWRRLNNGYFQNKRGEKLHRLVLNITSNDILVNHLGGNKWDNRMQSLSISNCVDNSKEKAVSIHNNSGIVGLLKRGNQWVGSIKMNYKSFYTKYKNQEDALIDLLIAQRHYGFRHNSDLYYLLDNVDEYRIRDVINNIERQLNKKSSERIIAKNKFKLSRCGAYYIVYDSNNNYFTIDIEDKKNVENGLWYVAKSKDKYYVHGAIIENGIRKTVRLHRVLFDIIDKKYKHIFVDHLNGDGLDNRRHNLELTDANGNGKNKPAKGYYMRWGKARASIVINGHRISKTFESEELAVEWYNKQRTNVMEDRLSFKSKQEVDDYLKFSKYV